MVYRVIGLMSGSSLDGLDIAFVELDENGGKWSYELRAVQCVPYDAVWRNKLEHATQLLAYDYCLLNAQYGKWVGEQVNAFIETYALEHKVQLIASHGHTTFHAPELGLTAQMGSGAAIAAETRVNVVSDLREMDVAFGGQGAPIVPIGEKLLFGDYDYLLNIGGIANLSCKSSDGYVAHDVCAANRVLNLLAQFEGKAFDENGVMAAAGEVNATLLAELNGLDYYQQPGPKSLANSFGTDVIFPLVNAYVDSTANKLRTYVEHIALQITEALKNTQQDVQPARLLATGGGAFNAFLVARLSALLQPLNVEVIIPDTMLVNYKEALIMALIGVLRWREEYNVLSSVTGAKRSSIGGAVWIGQEA